jgi:predicted nucleic acid-binding protein
MYSLDTSVFMDWQARYYPPDIFRSLISRIDDLIAKGECSAIDLVREEIDAVGTPELRSWAKSNKALFIPLDPEVQVEAASIEARYPDLMDPKSPYQSADAYVIALAKVKGGTVVSQETSAAEKRSAKRTHYIPDVCRNLGVPCINLLGLMRREKWTF